MEGLLLTYLPKVEQHIKNKGLVKHMIAVSAIMFDLAGRFGENPQNWAAVGLLHDVDLEEVNYDLNRHGLVSAEMLKELLPEELLSPIRRHNEHCGEKPEKSIDYALIAADGISGLLVSAALVMPNRKLDELTVESVVKKFKTKDFAKNVSREKIMYCEKLDLSLEEFVELAITALLKVRTRLGL